MTTGDPLGEDLTSRAGGGAAADPARIVVSTVSYGTADLVALGMPRLLDELSRFERGLAIVVDNASPDGDGERLGAFLSRFDHGGRVRLIHSETNGGFAAGNNIAFRALRDLDWTPDYVLLLNPDARLAPGALSELVRVMRDRPRAGVVGARLEREGGQDAGAAFFFPTLTGEFARAARLSVFHRLWPTRAPEGPAPTPADWVSGAAMMVRMAALEDVGGMDEGYFLYYEEVDFMKKLQRAGWEVWHAPEALAVHDEGAATGIVHGRGARGATSRYWYASWLRYFAKNHGPVYARATAVARLLGGIVGGIVNGPRGRPLAPRFWIDFTRYCVFGPIDRSPERRAFPPAERR